MKLGTMADVPSAEMKPHSDPVDVTKVEIFTGSVRIELVRNSESRNSVQENMKQEPESMKKALRLVSAHR